MIEPESVAMTICEKGTDAIVTLRRREDRVLVAVRHFMASVSRREAEHLRRALTRAIREIREIERSADAARKEE